MYRLLPSFMSVVLGSDSLQRFVRHYCRFDTKVLVSYYNIKSEGLAATTTVIDSIMFGKKSRNSLSVLAGPSEPGCGGKYPSLQNLQFEVVFLNVVIKCFRIFNCKLNETKFRGSKV